MPDDLLDELLSGSKDTKDCFEEEDRVLLPILEEVNQIQDEAIRLFVRAVLLQSPTFFQIPSSFSGKYHPPDESLPGGNVLHTKRVARIADIMCESQERTQFERDIVKAAAILHDLTKGVEYNEGSLGYDPMHPYTVDRFVDYVKKNETASTLVRASSTQYLEDEVIDQILRLVRVHMGPWSPIPETIPLTTLDWIVHFADRVASMLHFVVDGTDYRMERWILDANE